MPNTAPSASAHVIQQALGRVLDQRTFLQSLLIDALGWQVPETAERIEEIAFGWSQEELRAAELSKHVIDGSVWQIQSFATGQPWGIFLLEFKYDNAFTTGRGLTGPLRKVLRGLVPNRRRSGSAKSWNREHLLFICTHEYRHFRFAYFKSPADKKTAAPLATFGWNADDPARRTAWEYNLPALVWPDDPQDADAWVSRWSAAFDVEKVTKRFYEQYETTFKEVEGKIERTSGIAAAQLRLFTQTLFNRLMFLRFIERKGWLDFDGKSNYLATLMDAGGIGGKSVYQSRIRPLFFEGLAIEGRQQSPAIGKVPFLNGGLFDENDLDRTAKDVPDAALQPMIGPNGLFYAFNFTVEESTPLDIEVAVDPEMLGKVFERLVTGRHETGSYYTPKPIVSFMCREALTNYLEIALPGEEPASLARLVDDHDAAALKNAEAVLTALRAVKVCDPACGSGAYLLGMLHELLELRACLFVSRKVDPKSTFTRKLEIIENNLYGVDIDEFAVNIARLRLWLSLAVEADEPLALPNLDFKIETGDSLLGPCETRAKGLDFDKRRRERADTLLDLKDRYMQAHGREKVELRDAVLREEAAIATELRSDLGEGIIDWRIQFADVIGRNGGFDIVLANPPYIDSERMTRNCPDTRSAIQATYSLTRGNWDIYIAFFERGFALLRDTGVLTFITPDKWISKPFGDALRKAKTENLVSLLNAGRSIFESAKVDAIVTVFTSTGSHRPIRICSYDQENVNTKRLIDKAALTPPFAYDWLFSEWPELLAKLEGNELRLSDIGHCENACATSDAYKLSSPLKNSFCRLRFGDRLSAR